MMDPKTAKMLQSLGYFKDWSNYLLVATVAALGWVATKPVLLEPVALTLVIFAFCFSTIFAIFTLALIPIIGESISAETESFYRVPASFKAFWMWGPEFKLTLKWVCWPQHVLFLIGIVIFAVGSVLGAAAPTKGA
jgi:hypothetical protein